MFVVALLPVLRSFAVGVRVWLCLLFAPCGLSCASVAVVRIGLQMLVLVRFAPLFGRSFLPLLAVR